MRLIKLYIKDYKNLKEFSLDFEKGNGLSILIGNNGSGKSNVLEAISGIFAEAYGTAHDSFDTDYKFEYEIDNKTTTLARKDGKYHYFYNGVKKRRPEILEYLPSNVIAIYSGEDLRLWKDFYWQRYNSYLVSVYSKGVKDKMGMYYVNKYLWNISLLTLILFMSTSPDIKSFLSDEIGINDESDISLIHIDFSFASFDNNKNLLLKAFIEKINSDKKAVKDYSLLDFKKLISNLPDSFDAEPREVFNLLMWAFMPKSFKIIEDISIFLKDRELIQSLSEGEKKLILIKAVLEFIADENALLLLDEPDANIHEIRKRKLYDLLRNAPNRNIIMTTHSPTFVDMANDEELIVLKVDNEKNCSVCELSKIEQIKYLTGNIINIFSKKPILYCEGGTTSLEAELYPILFPNFTIIPSGGHTEVINNTKMYNRTFNPKSSAIGIIDGDYIPEEQKKALMVDSIYSLPVLEIENILMDLTLLEAAKEEFCSGDNCLDIVTKYLFEDCRKRKAQMAISFTKSHVVYDIISTISTEGKTLEDFKDNLLSIVDIDKIDKIYYQRIEEFEKYLSDTNAQELLRIMDFGHNINRFTQQIVDKYQSRIIRLIKRNNELKNKIIEKYFASLNDA